MTVFNASRPVNLSPAGLAPLVQEIASLSSRVETSTPSEFKIISPDSRVEFDFQSAAGDLSYNALSLPIAGTVSSFFINTNTGSGLSLAYSFTGMSTSVHRVDHDVLVDTPRSLKDALKAIFPGHDQINGSPFGHDHLVSAARYDTINPGPNDSMVSGPGNDIFVFTPGLGKDKVSNFIASGPKHDVIELGSLPLTTFRQVLKHSHIVHNELVISVDATDSITLANIHSKASLHAYDFHFVTLM